MTSNAFQRTKQGIGASSRGTCLEMFAMDSTEVNAAWSKYRSCGILRPNHGESDVESVCCWQGFGLTLCRFLGNSCDLKLQKSSILASGVRSM